MTRRVVPEMLTALPVGFLMRLVRTVAVCLLAVLFFPRHASAQDVPVSEVLINLYQRPIADIFNGYPQAEPDIIRQQLFALFLTHAAGAELSTVPLGSSAGGFTFGYDAATGVFRRNSTSFGPLFAERALTIGRGKFGFGLNYQRLSFDHFEGRELENGELKFYVPIILGFTTAPLQRDAIVEESLRLKLTTSIISLFGNYGITDRWDVGIVLPIISVKMTADLDLTGFNVQDQTQAFTDFSGKSVPRTESASGSASGIGDLVVRTKYTVLRGAGGGVAVGLDARLPTGDEKELLGIAGSQTKLYGIVSTAKGNLSPHVNIGYTFSRGTEREENSVLFDPADEINYAAGIDYAVSPRLTLTGDLLGRSLRDYVQLTETSVSRQGLLGSTFSPRPEFGFQVTSVHQPMAALGFKANPTGTLLVSLHVLVPLNDAGLQNKFTPVFGFDWSF